MYRYAIYAIAICLFTRPLNSELVAATKSLDAIIAEADAVVIGSFLAGRTGTGAIDADLVPEKVLKGVVPNTTTLRVRWTAAPGVPTWIPPKRGLLFLKRQDPWLVIPVRTSSSFDLAGWVPMPRTTRATPGLPDSTPKARILIELAHSSDPFVGLMTFEALCRSTPEAASSPQLATALRSSGDLGEGCLAAHGDVATILDLERKQQQRLPGGSVEHDYLLRQLRFYYRNPDTRGISVLGRLSVSSQHRSDARHAAASALAKIHTVTTLPYLAALLDIPDPFLQAAGVAGLSGFANNIQADHQMAPGEWKYRTAETVKHSIWSTEAVATDPRYLAFWKDWWRKNQADFK